MIVELAVTFTKHGGHGREADLTIYVERIVTDSFDPHTNGNTEARQAILAAHRVGPGLVANVDDWKLTKVACLWVSEKTGAPEWVAV